MDTLKKLRALLTRRDKQFLMGLLFFSFFISLIETVGISIIMPFITIASDFSVIESNYYYKAIYTLFSFDNPIDFVIVFGVFLVFFYIFRSFVNLLYYYALNKFSQGRYHLLAFRLFQNYLGFSYKDFVTQNSSYLTKTIVNEAQNLTTLIKAILFLLSEIFIVVFIYAMLLWVNYKITLVLTFVLVLNALFLTKTVSKRIKKEGAKRADFQKAFYEIIASSFGNFKIIKLFSSDDRIMAKFGEASYGFSQANAVAETLGQFPRLFLEAIGFGLIAVIITYMVWKYQTDIQAVIPIISMFVLALFRLLPSVNRIMSSYNNILFYIKSLDIVHNDLMYDSEVLGNGTVTFNRTIALNRVAFAYDEKGLFGGLSLQIKKGEKVAFIGESGAGKSTLVDLIMGLYRPTSGVLTVDDQLIDDATVKAWRMKIGYIPQSVYLFDGTAAENVVFGRAYNHDKLIAVLKQAHIYDFLQTKQGVKTKVGEGGLMLSGGQKQRIAIARALYGEPEVLVLDEATSALDDETEAKIMDEIYDVSRDKTLLVIAHRLSTIKRCETVYRMEDGFIKQVSHVS
jgi:ABC-type multidrug transport system fused ATPase/permease subunit